MCGREARAKRESSVGTKVVSFLFIASRTVSGSKSVGPDEDKVVNKVSVLLLDLH